MLWIKIWIVLCAYYPQPPQSAVHGATRDVLQVGQLASWKWQKVSSHHSLPQGFLRIISNAVSSLVSFFLRLCSEVPLLEDTLMRILVIGLSRDLPLGPADAMELADHLVKRAAGVQSDGSAYPFIHADISFCWHWVISSWLRVCVCVCFVDLDVLHVERIQLIDAVLNLCTYHHPENIQLPAG